MIRRALALVADDLAGSQLPGVVGPPQAARDFADRWVSTEGGSLVRGHRRADLPAHRRATAATRVRQLAPGEPGDRALLAGWLSTSASRP